MKLSMCPRCYAENARSIGVKLCANHRAEAQRRLDSLSESVKRMEAVASNRGPRPVGDVLRLLFMLLVPFAALAAAIALDLW